MKTVVLGGTGHIGTYLVPMLVEEGHEVISISRGDTGKPYQGGHYEHAWPADAKRTSGEPYKPHWAWNHVRKETADRVEEEKAGTFARRISGYEPDIVIDLTCFSVDSVKQMTEALRGKVSHYLFAGTCWVHGYGTYVPKTESTPRHPEEEYGRQKAMIEDYLLKESRSRGFPATVIHPGFIVGPGWEIVTPLLGYNPETFTRLAKGEEISMPFMGLGMVHHVHAEDVAQVFMKAVSHWSLSVGEAFNAVSAQALTMRGYAEAVASWFNKDANIKFVSWEEFIKTVSEHDAWLFMHHYSHAPCWSCEKAKKYLDYQPRYTALQACYESVSWMVEHGIVKVQAATQ